MNPFVKLLFSVLLLVSSSCAINANSEETAPRFKVILKLDDMKHSRGEIPAQWRRVHEYAIEQQLPFSVGIICNSLEGEYPNYFEGLKAWHASGSIEFWNHGYDHKQWSVAGQRVREFDDSGYDHQLAHFKTSQELAVAKLGFEFTTFGAPFNATDEDTKRVLRDFPEITAWLYGPSGDSAGKTVLKRNYSVNLEVKVGDVDFDTFLAAYLAKPVGQLLVLQGHPMGWDDADFESFTKIVALLKEQGAAFTLPRDCVAQ